MTRIVIREDKMKQITPEDVPEYFNIDTSSMCYQSEER
jgi:hypothetical protein